MYQQVAEESIYNLIPKECAENEKTVRYVLVMILLCQCNF